MYALHSKNGKCGNTVTEKCIYGTVSPIGVNLNFLGRNFKICTLGWHSGSVFHFHLSNKRNVSINYKKP